jgi:hypothetical protein
MKTIHDLTQPELEELRVKLFNATDNDILSAKGIYTANQMPMENVIEHFEGINFVDDDFFICNRNFDVKETLTNYFANLITSHEVMIMCKVPETKEVNLLQILGEGQKEWENTPCNPEGETPEQEKQLDAILEKYTNKILSLLN